MTYRLAFGSLAMILLCFAGGVVHAKDDPRVTERTYEDGHVVNVMARVGFQSTIGFGENEHIENVAIGNSAEWQITPNKRANLIFLKPASASATTTNMTVVTDRHTYLFELGTGPRVQPVYLLRFAYPDEPTPAASPKATVSAETSTVNKDTTPAQSLARLNFAWRASGSKELLPARSFDDGQAIYLAWPAGRDLPAVLTIGPDGKTEGPVNYSVNGDYLVVDRLYRKLILRSGKAVATLENHRPSDPSLTVPPLPAPIASN
jgi:type IV secretion system protein VirB9